MRQAVRRRRGVEALAHVLGDMECDPAWLAYLARRGAFVVPTRRVTALVSTEFAPAVDRMREELLGYPWLGPRLAPSLRRTLADPDLIARARAATGGQTGSQSSSSGLPSTKNWPWSIITRSATREVIM
jgi:hypothetical protein